MNDESNDEPMKRENPVVRALREFASHVPPTSESLAKDPLFRANEILHHASMKAAAISATLAIPPGPAGLATVVPDLIAIWKVQQQMVADVAGCFGKTAQLNPRVMLYCLFRHGAAMLVRDIVVRAGERILVKRSSLRVFQQLFQKLGIKVTQKLIGKSISRWMPVLGPILIGGYSLYDTRQVGKTSIDTFSREIIDDDGESGAGVPA
jgi:hypothetical protein